MKLDSQVAIRSIALCGLALVAPPAAASAQQITSGAAAAPSADFGAKIINAEQALAAAGRAYTASTSSTASGRATSPRIDAQAAVSTQIAAAARTLRAALAKPESLAVATEPPAPAGAMSPATPPTTAAGAAAAARSYIPEPPKPGMVGRVMGLAKLGGKKDKDVNQAIGKGVDEATQKATAQAVQTTLKLEFLYAVAALRQVSQEMEVLEVATAGKPTDLAPLADRYIAAIERAEEVLDIELPRLGMMAKMAAEAPELPEETRAKYKAVGERIAATVNQWAANRTLFARSERNAMDFLAMASAQPAARTEFSTSKQ